MLDLLEEDIKNNCNAIQAQQLQKYFRTGKGEYGEGDIFLGMTSNTIKNIAKKYKNLSFDDIQILLNSKYHEKRSIALTILIILYKYKNSNKEAIVDFYLNNIKNINNWDLVDISCYKILGDYLFNYQNKNYNLLLEFTKSNNMWKRRMSIVSTMIFVKNNYLEPTIHISKILLGDKEDLIKKAVGWLLREVGKKDKSLLKNFLIENIKNISSITLSYATEKLDKEEIKQLRLLKKAK